jgi:hypothetical protein
VRRDDILNRLHEQPFRPFYIRLSSGLVHLVQHPELVMVGGSSLVVGIPRTGYKGPGDIDDYAVVSLSHVVQIDPVSALPSPKPKADDGNGD